ncbi:RNA-binding protein Hfq [Peptococcaceae bacterium CEB3]|nr:RNA-binding protein Hfq [Peptococcaceae bacterium CEB3]
MNKSSINLQDGFLNQVRKENLPVTIYLVNGFQLKGIVRGFDNFTVVIEFEGKQQMVYKHAISTVMPIRPINLAQATAQPAAHPEEPHE